MVVFGTMAENKKSFIIYTSWKRWLDGLNLEQKGIWLDWMLSYTNDENPEFPKDQAVMIACMMAQDTLKRDLKKYEAKVERIKTARTQNPNNNKELLENSNQTEISMKSVRNQYEINTISIRNRDEISSVNVNVNDNVNVINNSNNINYSGKELNSNNINNNILSFPESEKDCLYKQIFDYWNSKKIVVHKNMTQELIKVLDKTLKLYSKEEVGHAIKHYAEMYHDKSYFFSYKWTLIEFLTRSNGLPEFLDNGNKWVNYLNRNNNTKQQSYNSVEELPEYMQQMLKEES